MTMSSQPSSLSVSSLPLTGSSTAVPNTGFHRRRVFLNKQATNVLVVVVLLFAALVPLVFGPSTAAVEKAILAEANYTLTELEEEIEVDPVVAAASIKSTAKLISAIVLGVLAAKYNILDHAAIDALAKLAYYLFEPALMLCSVARTLNVDAGGLSHRSLFLLMPLASVLHTVIGLVAGHAITAFVPMRSPSDERDLIFCITFANSANLPLVFAASLFPLSANMQADMTACISFYLLILCPIFYTLGVGFLQTEEEKAALQDPTKTKQESPADELKALILKCLNPPVIGSVLGVAVGTIPFMQSTFLGDNSIGAPLFGAIQTFGTAYLPATILVLAGSMVAADSSGGTAEESERASVKRMPSSDRFDDAAKPRTTVNPNLSITSVIWITVARFVIWPIATRIMIHLLAQTSLLANETPRNQAICTFVIMIQGCMPPAQNSVLLLQLAGMKDRAMRMTRLLTVLYCISVVPATILVSHSLESTGIMKFAQK